VNGTESLENLEESYAEYLLLISDLVDAIAELKSIIVTLRKEVNSLDPAKPYENDLLSDINHCFSDKLVAQKFPQLFTKLL
jgi:hypothetical protein